MPSYQAGYVSSNYSRERHMGRYYELGFRDLYPAYPECDCQHTEKVRRRCRGARLRKPDHVPRSADRTVTERLRTAGRPRPRSC